MTAKRGPGLGSRRGEGGKITKKKGGTIGPYKGERTREKANEGIRGGQQKTVKLVRKLPFLGKGKWGT